MSVLLEEIKTYIERSIITNKTLIDYKTFDDKFYHLLLSDYNEYNKYLNLCEFYQYIGIKDKLLVTCKLLLDKYIIQLYLIEKLYYKIVEYKNTLSQQSSKLSFINTLLNNFIKNGVLLDEKDKIVAIKHEINNLEENTYKLLNETEMRLVGFDREDLDGLPSEFYDKIIDEKVCIVMNKTNYLNCMKFINDSVIRKKLELCYSSKSFEIITNITKTILLKNKLSKLFNEDNYSEFKNEKFNVKEFLILLLKNINPTFINEINNLEQVKKDKINSWDIHYYVKLMKQKYNICDKKLSEYFPVKHVCNTIMEMYHYIFMVDFVKYKSDAWDKEVISYKVMSNNKLIGYIHLDLFNRPNKYKTIKSIHINNHSILFSSFKINKLLLFSEVITFFQEFVNLIQNIISFSNNYVIDNNISTIGYYVMENLCWHKDVIKKLSKHHITNKQLDNNTINKLIQIRDVEFGIHCKQHILIAMYDHLIHTSSHFISTIANSLNTGNNETLNVAFGLMYKDLHEHIFSDLDNKIKINFNNGMLFPGLWIEYLIKGDSNYYNILLSKITASNLYHKLIKNNDINKLGPCLKDIFIGKQKVIFDNNIQGFLSLHHINIELHKLQEEKEKVEVNVKDQPYNDSETYLNKFSEVDYETLIKRHANR